ncbi:hypothetical protein RAS12_04135 [Achromobacter seleniivolatilans]|uniref:Surface-adhesin protein E-like domain-containing protein n=1 Tax=Achromobacter seleniivolatilans TaxID=3047478 RepID=A0ABY9M6Z2_9BURK|nr:surface-adhesin E family protein [Achromobacter sp. R39]WMD21572.1 hypothetical protein RAS12_04135 [Achromobacter sp. R39]
MKKIAVVVFGILVSSMAHAAPNWQKLMDNEMGTMFLDKNSIQDTKAKNTRQADLLINYKDRSGIVSTVTVYEINCKTKKDRRVKVSDYEKSDAQGRLFGSTPLDESFEPADPGMVKLICP